VRLEISAGVWMSWFLGAATQKPITTVGRRQIGTPARAVRGSELVAMVDPGRGGHQSQHRRTTPGHHATSRHGLATLVITAWKSQLSRRTARMRAAYVRGIAVRAGELSLCVGRICVVSAGGAYALALLAIGALGESVSLSDKTKPVR
jgi:hypothetical protein